MEGKKAKLVGVAKSDLKAQDVLKYVYFMVDTTNPVVKYFLLRTGI